jgi:hypothetical protein
MFQLGVTYLFTRDDKDYYLRMFDIVPMEEWSVRSAGAVIEVLPNGSVHYCQLRQLSENHGRKSLYWRRMTDAVRRAVALGVLDKAQGDAVLS